MRALVATLFLGAAVIGNAQVIDTYPYYDGSVTQNWNEIGQSFTAPGSTLTDYQFAMQGNGASPPINVSVYNWVEGVGPTGAALYSTDIAWPSDSRDVVLSGIDVPMTIGGQYGVVVDLHTENSPSVYYMNNVTGNPTGHGYWKNNADANWTSFPGLSTEFRATFSSVPEPASMAVLGVGALALLRRRRKS